MDAHSIDKRLTLSAWKNISKGRELGDADFKRALGNLEKATDAAARLEAVREVQEELVSLRRTADDEDEELTSHLDELERALAGEQEDAESAAEEEEQEGDGEDDADGDNPALLTTKLLSRLRAVKSGAAMHALAAAAGRASAVVLSKAKVSAGHKKLLAASMDVSSGIKYLPGQCIFEKNAVTFVFETKVGGLARNIRNAILKQTGQQMKVRVRTTAGEEDTEGDEDAAPGAGAGSRAEQKPTLQAAIAGWKTERSHVIAQLAQLGKAILADEYPGAKDVIIVLGAIRRNLTESPQTRASLDELQRYLETDEIIDEAEAPNPYGVKVSIKEPLLRALADLRQVVPS